jgi:hypothetical protein
MAEYKRQVTNKYYGAGNSGKVYTNTESDGLAKSLINSSQKFGNAIRIKQDLKKDDAIEKIQAMEAGGKNLETIQSEILAGKHPDLTGKYVEATTQFHSGRVKAAEVINGITTAMEAGEYDISTMQLNDFYKKFIPDFDGQDTSFMAGFGSNFNYWKAKQAEKDAADRGEIIREKKISDVRTVLANVPDEDLDSRYVNEWKNFGTTLRTSDNKGVTQFYTNEELMIALRQDVASLIDSADTPEKIERAEKIMSLNLGKGRDGTELGSLNSRKNIKTDALKAALISKRDAITQKVRRDETYETAKATQAVWVEAFTPNEDGTPKTPLQLNELKQRITIASKGNAGDIDAFTEHFNRDPKDRQIKDYGGTQDFLISISKGEFTSNAEMFREFVKQGIPQDMWQSANARWDRYEKSYNDGALQPISETDNHYVKTKDRILRTVAEKYKIDDSGLGTKEAAQSDVLRYVDFEIEEQEMRWEAEGTTVTPKMRKDFIMEVQDYVDKTWTGVGEDATADNYQKPKTFDMPEVQFQNEFDKIDAEMEARNLKAQQETNDTVIFQRDAGDGVVDVTLSQYVNEITENIKKAGKQDFLLAPRIEGIISQEEFIKQVRDPKFQTYIQEILGSEFNGDILSAMSEDDYRTILINMTTSLGLMEGTDEEKNANLNQIQELLFNVYNIER